MTKAFTVSTNTKLTAQPSTGSAFYARSTNGADTANLTVSGLVTGIPTSETNALAGQKEVLTSNSFTSLTAAVLASTEAGTVSVFQNGIAGAGNIVVNSLPANNDTLQLGVTGFTRTYTFKTSLTGSANEVKIAASINAQATNIYEALDAGSGAGTDYGTGTTAHADIVAAAPVGAAIAYTDRIGCNRALGWVAAQTVGTTLSLVAPQGGVDGTLLASFAAGVTQLTNTLTLSSEDLVATTLPAKVFPTTDAILLSGKECTIRLRSAAVSSGIAVKYQTSTDSTNWLDGTTSITNLNNNKQWIVPAEKNNEYLRLVFTANTNTTDTAVDARVIFPLV